MGLFDIAYYFYEMELCLSIEGRLHVLKSIVILCVSVVNSTHLLLQVFESVALIIQSGDR